MEEIRTKRAYPNLCPGEDVVFKKHMFPDGSWYMGEWKDGMMHGRGLFMYANGSWYEGDFDSDMFHGHGKRVILDGSWYEGEWKYDTIHGNGVLVEKSEELGTMIRFEGHFTEGMKNGFGRMVYADESFFYGEWKYGEIHYGDS